MLARRGAVLPPPPRGSVPPPPALPHDPRPLPPPPLLLSAGLLATRALTLLVSTPRAAARQLVAARIAAARGVGFITDRRAKALRREGRHRAWRGAIALLLAAGAMVAALLLLTAFSRRSTRSRRARLFSAFEQGCAVFCEGPLLAAVQSAALFSDCKTFVDAPLLTDPSTALAAFAVLASASAPDPVPRAALQDFVASHFRAAGSDFLPHTPLDYSSERPPALARLRNASIAGWLHDVHRLWPELTRVVTRDVRTHPERHSLIWLPHPIVVPGGRFRCEREGSGALASALLSARSLCCALASALLRAHLRPAVRSSVPCRALFPHHPIFHQQ